MIKKHPETGYQILKSVDEYASLANYVLYHHERIDGTGYPEGLKGEDIPLVSRIIAVADAYEAMTSKRSYQAPRTREEAAKELLRCSGTQFDSEIVGIFVRRVLGLDF
jgi:HD-GYP domain-containing protein (c-di-GMP phosphodiesterase class II)